MVVVERLEIVGNLTKFDLIHVCWLENLGKNMLVYIQEFNDLQGKIVIF